MSGKVGDNLFRASGVVASSATDYDDDQIQSNIAILGFYVAVNGSLVRYNLVDQSIDEYFDTSGVDASASTGEIRSDVSPYYYVGGTSASPTVTEDADDSGVDGDYTWYKWTDTGATGSYANDTEQDHDWLVVGGGGAGCNNRGAGGGGAGGYRAGASLTLTADVTYTATIGAGAAKPSGSAPGSGSDSSLAGTGITTITSTGGGKAGNGGIDGGDGGSGGGASFSISSGGDPGAGNTPAITPITGETTTVQGYDGGTSSGSGDETETGGGGGGASAVGANSATTVAGAGGAGTTSSIAGSAVGYAGGGGASSNNPSATGGSATDGGGAGRLKSQGNGDADDGTANTGGGGGGHCDQSMTGSSGGGGSGIVVLRRLTNVETVGGDMVLQSTDVTALAEPTYGELVMLMENAYGTATLNTDIKGFVSCDSGVTFAEGTLVDEGSWGTNKKILAFHDLDISSQTGTSMCYKITTHNQSAGSKETRIYATSIGWR